MATSEHGEVDGAVNVKAPVVVIIGASREIGGALLLCLWKKLVVSILCLYLLKIAL